MKNIHVLLNIYCFCFVNFQLHGQVFQWATSNGSSLFDLAECISTDSEGNIYSVGKFEATVDFDPGAGVVNISSIGDYDMFIQKLDADGHLVWAKSIGGMSDIGGNSIDVDEFGNLYITGYFFETVDFDPGVGTYNLTSVGNKDVFVLKLNEFGDFMWAHRFGSNDDDVGKSIIVDLYGDICLTGFFSESVDFNPSASEAICSTTGPFAYTDVYVLKLNSLGEFIWVKSFGGNNSEMSYSLTTDFLGDYYITGHFRDVADFDPGAGVFNYTSNGEYDFFLLKLDVSGNFVWAKTVGGTGNDEAFSVTAKGSHGVFLTGYFNETVDFDPDPISENIVSSNGLYDGFILKLNLDGNFNWVHTYGSTGNDFGNSITIDSQGNTFCTGQYENTVDFDSGLDLNQQTSNGSADIFVQKLSPTGSLEWVISEGGTGYDIGKSITVNETDEIYLNGGFNNTVDFDFNEPIYELNSSGSFDFFVQKINVNELGFDIHDKTNFSVYPNPTSGELFIESQESITALCVINALGEKVFESKSNISIQSVCLDGLSNGIYSLQLYTGGQLINRRIIVNHN